MANSSAHTHDVWLTAQHTHTKVQWGPWNQMMPQVDGSAADLPKRDAVPAMQPAKEWADFHDTIVSGLRKF